MSFRRSRWWRAIDKAVFPLIIVLALVVIVAGAWLLAQEITKSVHVR